MIKKVENPSVAALLNPSGNMKNKYYSIPKYQREYTWGKYEWDQLFKDLIENDCGYFLGSIICVNDSQINELAFEVIDGQQRLTTLSILLSLLYSKLSKQKSLFVEDDDLISDYLTIKKELFAENIIGDSSHDKMPRLHLQIMNDNKKDFEALLNENGILEGVYEKVNHRGNRRIYSAYRYFEKKISEYILESDDEEYNVLFKIAEKVNSAVLVDIEVDTNKDAYMLFESLNNRGVPLSAIDLIKNLLISVSEKDNATDATYDKWRATINNLSDSYSAQERFFRQYYNAFRDELNKPFKDDSAGKMYPLGYKATKTTLLDIYEKLIKADYVGFLDKISKASENYAVIINNAGDNPFYNSLKNLERISGAPSYLLLLYLFENKNKLTLVDDDIIKIIDLLCRFFVRRSLTDRPNTRNLDKMFMGIIQLLKESSDTPYDTIRNQIISWSADDTYFEERLRGPVYLDNTDTTRFVLCQIEAQHQTKEIYTNLWSRDSNNKYIWTIEHIFPEGDNIPDCWIEMIADGDRNLAKTYLAQYVHNLGNLTMTGFNSKLSNMSFDRKKNRQDNGKDIGYKNGLFLNSDIVTETEWHIKNITDRTDKLVAMAIELFKL